MKRILISAVMVICMQSTLTLAQQKNNIADFYPLADSVTQFPPFDKKLSMICQKRILQRYVTFIGIEGEKKVLLVAVTLKKIRSIQDSISLSVEFKGIMPHPGRISTWGYVFDRNNDGKVDYMALVGGAAPFKDENFPDDYPLRGEPLSAYNQDELEYWVSHCKLVFNHWADDNFDDTLDALIHIDLDPQRDWVERKIVVQSTKFNGRFDDVWAFYQHIDEEPDTVGHSNSRIPYHPIGKPNDAITKAMLDEKTNIMLLIQRASRECGLTKENFSDGKREE
ncbi:MAG: hypothetical protein HY707_04295 [Ignavibacteriae bacterium]|nr:hypothetical protein [Ignavibacteriota bacterium]